MALHSPYFDPCPFELCGEASRGMNDQLSGLWLNGGKDLEVPRISETKFKLPD
jgi:hypothetical protein